MADFGMANVFCPIPPIRVFTFPLLIPLLLGILPISARGGEENKARRKMGDRDLDLLTRVNSAVVRGTRYLEGLQRRDGSWAGVWATLPGPYRCDSGETALVLLLLYRCGMGEWDGPAKRAETWLRRTPFRKTSEVAVLLLALAAKHYQLHRGWQKRRDPSPADRGWMREGVRFLLEHRAGGKPGIGVKGKGPPRGVWGYPGGSGDHVNTVLALLALRAVSRLGIEVPREVWLDTIPHFLEVQEETGPKVRAWFMTEDPKTAEVEFRPVPFAQDRARGWGYRAEDRARLGGGPPRTRPTGAMTCAGIACLAMALERLGSPIPPLLKAKAEQSIRDGLAWVDRHWTVHRNPCHLRGTWGYFFLSALEWACGLTWSRNIGRHDGYREGAEWLLANQEKDGSWTDPRTPDALTNTCFALLFLTRGTVADRKVIAPRSGLRRDIR
ncbi:MAG: prenyltransferase/squalene oxidase repeat-containing protein [Planctomycetota bacterium]|jgi:hypothetical protein